MHSYEKKYRGLVGNVSLYAETLEEIQAYAAEVGEPIRAVAEGYADEDYIGPGHPQYHGIEGTLVSRRTSRVLEPHEWEMG